MEGNKKYILTGGGSGGHIYPSLAIAQKIKKEENDSKFLYIGTKNRLESKIVPKAGYEMKFVKASGLPASKISLSFLVFILNLLLGISKSALLIMKFKPDMIIATGGFVSAPVVFGGVLLRFLHLSKVKIFLHEANAEPGKMTKFSGKYCDGVGLAYNSALKYFKTNGSFVGFPVRDEFFTGNREEAREKLEISKDKFVVLSVGGSQGARAINRGIIDSLKFLKDEDDLLIIHGTGREGKSYNPQKDIDDWFIRNGIKEDDFSFYSRKEYIDNMKDYYYAADIIITRGGAGALTEIAVCNRASIIIPKSALSGDHQVINAEVVKQYGTGDIVYESVIFDENNKFTVSVTGQRIAEKIKYYKNNKSILLNMEEKCNLISEKSGSDYIYDFIQNIMNNKKVKNNLNIAEKKSLNPYLFYSGFKLVSVFSKKTNEEILNDPYRDYLKYRIERYFLSDSWKIRNIGVKLVGLLQEKTMISFLHNIFIDKTPNTLILRFFGGDCKQVPFIRRNVMIAYRKIDILYETIENDIFLGLNDSYYECVVEALKNTVFFFDKIKDKNKLQNTIKSKLLQSKNFEIVVEAIKSYKYFIKNFDQFNEVFQSFFFADNSKIRDAVLEVIFELYESNVLIDKDKIKEILNNMLTVSSDFTPYFKLKSTLRKFKL